MSDTKKYNSIVFLTTLSVYLGLVLVGGAGSPVLAQAALTRNFDIQEEIEYKDDLDKKPDDELLVSSILGIVSDLNEFSSQGVLSWDKLNSYQVESFSFCESDNLPSFMGGGTLENQIHRKLDNNIVALARRIFTKETDLGLGDFHSHNLEFWLSAENKSLNLKFEIKNGSGENASVFADQLTSFLTQISLKSGSTKEKLVAENTKVTFENNQVFIITNLPRASINSLLADKDAK